MNPSINEFLLNQSCANIACLDHEGKPYSFSCFYAFDEAKGLLYFKSSLESAHASYLLQRPNIAGTILPDKLNKLQVKGLQFEGLCLTDTHPLAKDAAYNYHKSNPIALAMPGKVWTIQLEHMKLTDSSLGFGKKLHWYAQTAQAE